MNTKKIITILSVLVLITIIISLLLLILYNNNTKTNNKITGEYIATPSTEIDPIEIEENLKEVTVRNNFFVVKNCITKFYTYYSAIYNNKSSSLIMDEESIASLEIEKKQNIEAVYNILDENYKSYKNITLDNLTKKLSTINTNTIEVTDMYVTQKDENISIYFVYGYLIDTSLSKISEFLMMVNVDMLNRTYSVLLGDYVKQKYGDVEIGESIKVECPQQIQNNTYNTFKYQAISDDIYISNVFNNFKNNMLYNVSQIYKNLDETYKQKRFQTLKNFEEYTNSKIKEFSIMNLSKYQKIKYDEYIQYVCLANNDKYYIINEFSPMKYNVILDTYTIDLPEFIEKYERSDDKTKVALNIQKIKNAINENDFQYVYNKLDTTFKQNNFSKYNNFKEYLISNLFDKNNFEYKNIEKQGDVYVATIIINDVKKMEIIMQLSDNTDFYMSFNIEE